MCQGNKEILYEIYPYFYYVKHHPLQLNKIGSLGFLVDDPRYLSGVENENVTGGLQNESRNPQSWPKHLTSVMTSFVVYNNNKWTREQRHNHNFHQRGS